jgi:hypothetical protein
VSRIVFDDEDNDEVVVRNSASAAIAPLVVLAEDGIIRGAGSGSV